jgi:lysophospholipase L1-like esterase
VKPRIGRCPSVLSTIVSGANHIASRAIRSAGALFVIGLLTLGALGACSAKSPPIRPVIAGPPRIMLVGDSITQGSAGKYTWRYRLYQHLEAAGVHTDFVGPRHDLHDLAAGKNDNFDYADANFDTDHDALWGRPLAEAVTTISAEVRDFHPDYVIVLLGINDILSGVDAGTVEGLMVQFIANARLGNPNVRLVLCTPLPAAVEGRRPDLSAQIADYADRITRLAGRSSTSSSPVRGAQTGQRMNPKTDLDDGLHPNTRGEIKVADEVAYTLAVGYGIGNPDSSLEPVSTNTALLPAG